MFLVLAGAVAGLILAIVSSNRDKLVTGVANDAPHETGDFGGVISQSFRCARDGRANAVRFFIEARENPRDLLVLLRRADEDGYPIGKVLASGLATVAPGDAGEAVWHEVLLEGDTVLEADTGYALELSPSTPHGGYGYFEYGYTMKDRYPEGRLHLRGHGRRESPDDGRDLAFAVILEVPDSSPGERPEPLAKTSTAPGAASAPDLEAEEEEANARDPELSRLLEFLRMHRLDLDGQEGVRVRMWARLEGGGAEWIIDEVITSTPRDIYYGHSDDGAPVFHLIDADGGGGSRYLPQMGRTHYMPDVSLEDARDESVLVGREYSKDSKIWLRLSDP